MSSLDVATVARLLQNGPHRSEVGRKQLTLALGGQYIASTTPSAKPILVWESEKGYARYYLPVGSLHNDIRERLTGTDPEHGEKTNGYVASKPSVTIEKVETIEGKGNQARALIEKLTVGPKSTTWVRFVEGDLKGLIRFERNEIGKPVLCVILT